ncbi:MAG: phosphotransferase [Bacteroidales bacterium]|nr:phosphotransferase [Bacteroidales bacterium]
MADIITKIEKLYFEFSNNKNIKIVQLKQSGSYRQYYRISSENEKLLGVYNPDKTENEAFLSFSEHFKSKNLNVPNIIARFDEENIYFIEDFGDLTVYDFLKQNPTNSEIVDIYKKILNQLVRFQFDGVQNLDTSKCYPRAVFDKQSIMWDLNYFKYFVLKIAKVTFNEQKLEDDFNNFSDFLISTNLDYFLYRDFQSKNIMLVENEPYFIDYQGGRKGAVYYDLASLLFDSKANLTEKIKVELKKYYFEIINQRIKVDEETFEKYYNNYALVRVLQAFGAYGFRGLVERKQQFIASIPKAFKNISYFLDNNYISDDFPMLKQTLKELVNSELANDFDGFSDNLRISINSFSFLKDGYPEEKKGNGGGFVFDCRFLPNPGRIDFYKPLSGLDKPVKEYLEGCPEVETFISDVVKMIKNAAKSYSEQGFTNLQVNFGCTGGRHRSVYCAEKSAEILKNLYGLNITIDHLQKDKW